MAPTTPTPCLAIDTVITLAKIRISDKVRAICKVGQILNRYTKQTLHRDRRAGAGAGEAGGPVS
jgi:hypothetical protein